MERNICICVGALLLLSASACGTASGSPDSQVSDAGITEQTTTAAPESETFTETTAVTAVTGSYTAEKPSEPVTLTNRMTDYERACAAKRPFSLLDAALPEPEIRIGTVHYTKEAAIALYQSLLESGSLSEEEYQEWVADFEAYSGKAALINGVQYDFYIPPEGYDGGKLTVPDGETFPDKEAFFADARRYCTDSGYSEAQTKNLLKQMQAVFRAVIDNTYTALPDREKNYLIPFHSDDPYADYRSAWEYDADALAAIQGHIEEYTLYDEQLGLPFLVHVTLPPDYDAEKTYPVFLMTDGVWRLNDHAALWHAMENGEAADVILVSLAYTYNFNGTDDQFRETLFIKEKEKLLSFITDDLMPYLGEQYHIDCAESTLFGHSMGGVFSHYACFMSDKYENQPFFRYIVGSPALFNLYGNDTDYDAADAEHEYGYFDRHDALDKKLFLCGGSLEDPDYADSYHGHDSLLTGLGKMTDRLAAQKADYICKLYESHHYQYVPLMLAEYLKAEYPAQ